MPVNSLPRERDPHPPVCWDHGRVIAPAARWSLRGAFLLIGAGLALSLGLLVASVVLLIHESGSMPVWQLAVLGTVMAAVPLAALGLLPVVRTIEGAAAQSLLQVVLPDGIPGPSHTWSQRWRTFGWFVLHMAAGAVLSVGVMVALVVPGWWPLAVVAATLVVSVVCIAVLAWWAPQALGPSSAERLARAEQDLELAVERDRIAREIHDGVGHALSIVTVQAAAARRVLDRDPAFAATALAAIEDASRDAAGDLDHALGLLRGDSATATAPARDLADLPVLVEATRAAGLAVDWDPDDGEVPDPPLLVSREAYRVVQEALTNALRHSSDRCATLTLERTREQVRITVENPVGPGATSRTGRGLRGMGERVGTLGGALEAGVDGERWRLVATLPAVAAGAR